MPHFLIIVKRDDEIKSYSFEYCDSIEAFTEMLRDFNLAYEIYRYDSESGYIRSICWPGMSNNP